MLYSCLNRALVSALISILALSGCQTVSYDKPIHPNIKKATDVERTWLYAKVRIPAKYSKTGKEERFPLWVDPPAWSEKVTSMLASPTQKHPVAVFLHGCEGLNASNQLFVDFLSGSEWLVFAPDSFARPGRKIWCHNQRGTPTYQHRLQEAKYALTRLNEASWVDESRLVLVGHSEGGEVAGLWSELGYSGIVISGADCTASSRGSYAPFGIPVLSIVGGNDPTQGFPCSVSGRPNPSKSVTIPGAGHSVYLHANAEREMRDFLGKCCSK